MWSGVHVKMKVMSRVCAGAAWEIYFTNAKNVPDGTIIALWPPCAIGGMGIALHHNEAPAI
jgi:hypothetical protein